MLRVRRNAFCITGAAVLLAGRVLAEPVPSLDLRGFRPPTHPEGLLSLEPTAAPGPGDWNVGSWFSYAVRPIVVPDSFRDEDVPVIEHQLSLDLVGSIGVGERLGVGVSLPVVLAQAGDEPPPSLGMTEPPPTTALGDALIDARATLLPQGELGGLGLAVQGRVSLPTGNPASFASETQTRTEIRLLGELSMLGLSLRAAAGARVRGAEREFAGGTYGHDLPWGLGFVLRPQVLGIDREGLYLFGLDAHGAIAITPSFASREESPAALTLAAKRSFGDASLTVGAELPLDGAQGVPIVRAIAAIGWAPRKHDEDDDGIDDDADHCRTLAEDKDGFEDADGCPDFDNDGDGVADADDRCPKQLEDRDHFADEDGCPDPDDDADGIPDTSDACPREAGPALPDPKLNGCALRDRDKDGIADPYDRCPTRREDTDGFEDADGCPDPDNDRDGVRDRDDECPNAAGIARSDPKLNGCPSPDKDGDTYDDAEDQCPDAAETFDGTDDQDGCPEARARRALARFESATTPRGARELLRTTGAITFDTKGGGARISAAAEPIVRAIGALLNAHPDHVIMVAVRPTGTTPAAEQAALTKSFAVVDTLRSLTHRDDVAETIGWAALGRVPGAARPEGIGFLVLAPVAPPSSPAPSGAKRASPVPPPALPPPSPPREGDAR
jgi:OOP family OmpA-OmpF porin